MTIEQANRPWHKIVVIMALALSTWSTHETSARGIMSRTTSPPTKAMKSSSRVKTMRLFSQTLAVGSTFKRILSGLGDATRTDPIEYFNNTWFAIYKIRKIWLSVVQRTIFIWVKRSESDEEPRFHSGILWNGQLPVQEQFNIHIAFSALYRWQHLYEFYMRGHFAREIGLIGQCHSKDDALVMIGVLFFVCMYTVGWVILPAQWRAKKRNVAQKNPWPKPHCFRNSVSCSYRYSRSNSSVSSTKVSQKTITFEAAE